MVYTIVTSILGCLFGCYLGYRSTKKQYAEKYETMLNKCNEIFGTHSEEELKNVVKLLKENSKIGTVNK